MPGPFGKLSDVGRRTVVRCQPCVKGVFSVQEPPGDLAGSSAPGLAAGALTGPLARRMLPRVDRREVAAIFAGGALGTLLRAALAEAFPHPVTAWPWPTFAVNIVAAFALGYFVTRLQERLPLSSYRRPLLGTGLCGGLSTFSTMQVEILEMLDAHAWGLAAGYAAASVAAGYAAIHLATAMVRRVRVHQRASGARPRLD
jgi:CrcB protein